MAIKVEELIEILSTFSPDADVYLAIQPKWALQMEVDKAVEVYYGETPKVFIGESPHGDNGYLDEWAAFELGWGEAPAGPPPSDEDEFDTLIEDESNFDGPYEPYSDTRHKDGY